MTGFSGNSVFSLRKDYHWQHHFKFPIVVYKGSTFSVSLPTLATYLFSVNNNHSNGCEVAFNCGFGLYSLMIMMLNISHVLIGHLYISLKFSQREKEKSWRWGKSFNLLNSLEVNSSGEGGHCSNGCPPLYLHLWPIPARSNQSTYLVFGGQGLYCPSWHSQAVCGLL